MTFFFFLKKKEKKIINNFIIKKKSKKKIFFFFVLNNYLFFKKLFISIIISKKNIFIQFFIIKNDVLGKKFLSLLKKKSHNCEIIIIVDRIGTFYTKYNFNILYFNIDKFLLNLRNHKKIILIDKKIIWIISSNIGSEYINYNLNIQNWNDFYFKIKNYFNLNFLNDYYFLKKKIHKKTNKVIFKKKFFIINNLIHNYLILIFFIIKKSLIIITPYIVLDNFYIKLIKFLILKKIILIIILSNNIDNLYTHFSSLIFFKILNFLNINVFFLKKGFNHKKIFVIDKNLIWFGSMNFDNRSIYLNYEFLFLITSKNFIKIFLNSFLLELNYNFINCKKKIILLKFFYIISFLNYLNT